MNGVIGGLLFDTCPTLKARIAKAFLEWYYSARWWMVDAVIQFLLYSVRERISDRFDWFHFIVVLFVVGGFSEGPSSDCRKKKADTQE